MNRNDDLSQGWGLFNDDGTRIDPDLVPIPPRCLTCRKHGKGGEFDVLCTLNRADQADDDGEFKCGEYEALR
ncbi:MAG: hypothetical protein GF331_18450 [Chitinivibrionales bacterium]|nr:hypothetical protein [Chitinivibrionales bacterium]